MTAIIIVIIILVLGLGLLLWIFFKKLPQLRMLDPDSLKDAKAKKLKYDIMRQRVERASSKQLEGFQKYVLQPIGKGLQGVVRRVAGKLTAVERSYQEKRLKSGEVTMDKAELDAMVDEGKKLLKEEEYDRAEKRFIEVISHDAKNVRAYEYLGRLYQYKKDLALAKQTFQFLQKLSPDDASVIASLGEVEEASGNMDKALKHYQKAVDLSPKNPKYLDFLIDSLLEKQDIVDAQEKIAQLREANPENKKIEEFEERLSELKKMLVKGKISKKKKEDQG